MKRQELVKFSWPFNKEVKSIVMALTNNCNLDCSYCYVNKKNDVMDFVTVKNSVDFLMNSPGEKKEIHFFGGEPLLVSEMIKKTVEYAESNYKEKAKKISYTITTNGTLLDEDKARYLKEKNFKINISLDGSKDTNGRFRKFDGDEGKSSYELILKNIELLKKEKTPFSINMTVHPSAAQDLYKNYLHILSNVGANINIMPASLTPWTKEQILSFLRNCLKIISYHKNEKIQGRLNLLEDMKNTKNVYNTSFSNYPICPFKTAITITPLGEIIFCHFFLYPNKILDRYVIGNINKGVREDYRLCRLSNTVKCKNCSFNYCNFFCKQFESLNHQVYTPYFKDLLRRAYEKHSKP